MSTELTTSRTSHLGHRSNWSMTVFLLALVLTSAGLTIGHAAPAQAAFGLTGFDGEVLRQDGTEADQAGEHPYTASTTMSFTTRPGVTYPQTIEPQSNLGDVQLELPVGFVGNPTAVPQCSPADFYKNGTSTFVVPGCAPNTTVGLVDADLGGNQSPWHVSLYNMVPAAGRAAQFYFKILSSVVVLDAYVIPGSGRLQIKVSKIPQGLGLLQTRVTLWGVPADPSHDAERGVECYGPNDNPLSDCIAYGPHDAGGIPPKPFLTNPTFCNGPVETDLQVSSWAGEHDASSFLTHDNAGNPIGPVGCENLVFSPSISVQTTTTVPDAPTGLHLDLKVPQTDNPDGLATPTVRNVAVTLPDGMTINPSAAGGLQGCPDADLGLANGAAVTCPDASKIGTATATTPLLAKPLTGSIYIRTQASQDPGSGAMFRLALTLEDPERGILIKLPGAIVADPQTGRLTTTFVDNPQLPFSDLTVDLKAGPRAPLATPSSCGTTTVESTLTSWAGQTVHRANALDIDCPRASGEFAPTFSAGTMNPVAGGSSAFALRISRADGDQFMNGLTMTLPAGLTAKLAGVPQCAAASADAGACPQASRVGTATVGAGPGSNPYFLKGGVYLTGPYKDAPFGLAVAVRAIAGPFDLGTVVVRQQLLVDPVDAHVTVVSDPLPTILKGVPIRLRSLNVDVDRPNFMLNPTSCAPKTITATLGAVDGQRADVSSPFGLGDCAALDLAPKLALSLSGKGQTTDNTHPALTAVLRQTPGQANLRTVAVTLPLSLALDPGNSQSDALCEFEAGRKTIPECPASSVVGTATARTPILDQPLTGPVYFVKNVRFDAAGMRHKTLPTLAIVLRGEGVTLVLRATSAVPDGKHLVTTFENIPDAPVSDFTLNINGGPRGILVVSRADLCKATQVADQAIDGQNGKTADAKITMSTPCALAVVASSHTPTALKLTVGGIGAGKVSVSGNGLATTSRTIGSATTATLQPKLTKPAQTTLAHHGNVKTRVTVSFTPTGAKKATTTHKTLTIHGATT